MVHCRGCGQQIHESAVTCPHCGAPQGTSSMTATASLPPGIQGWSWGAFLFNWVWGIFNGTWIALLCLIPVVGVIVAFMLGFKGREWAWRNKKWESVEHFQRVQRAWSAWAIGLTAASVVIGIIAAIALPAYHDYTQRALNSKALIESARIERERERATQAEAEVEAAKKIAQAAAIAAEAPVTTPTTDMTPNLPGVVAASTSMDVLNKAMTCSINSDCVEAMLKGANPRRPDVLQAAAMRLAAFETAETVDKKLSRDLNTQALVKYSANDFKSAAALFAQGAHANPRDVEIRANLGLAYVRLENPSEAVTALVAALQLDPRRANAWGTLAVAMDQVKMHEMALEALLLTYEFSGNKQKTIEFFRSRITADDVSESLRKTYVAALKTVESGY